MAETSFRLHAQLEADTAFITDLKLSRVLLINDSNFPWTVLVPRRLDATDIYTLSRPDQVQYLLESEALCKSMVQIFKPDKMNVAAIGNIVPQLHIHHVARFTKDIAWPAPVWGFTQAKTYPEDVLQTTVDKIRDTLMVAFI